ncbi:hypothetical protein Tco_1427047 [Tanacetum coccineum]
MTELMLNENVEKVQTESNLSNTNDNINIELNKEFLMELQRNAYHGWLDEDIVDHIAKVLEILDLIKIPNVDTDRLCTKVFPLSLANDAKQWWVNECEGKITTWGILVGRFFCKYFPLSRDGKNYVANSNNADEPGYYELKAWLDSRHDNERIDRTTKSALCHSWIYGWGKNESTDDIVSSNDEWEEYDYENPPNTTIDSFFKPYSKTQEKNNVDKEDKRSQTRRKHCNNDLNNDEQPIKRVCKTEKFEAIKYSLGRNEEYIAIRRYEYDDWERNEDSMSKIYQEFS